MTAMASPPRANAPRACAARSTWRRSGEDDSEMDSMASVRASRQTGIASRKMLRHPNHKIITPPSVGATANARPLHAAQIPRALPRRAGFGHAIRRNAKDAGVRRPATNRQNEGQGKEGYGRVIL